MTWGRPRSTKTLLDTIYEGIDDENGEFTCHPWEKSLAGGGFPHLKYHGKNILVHRYLLQHFLPCPGMQGLVAVQTCGNRTCCNLLHLRWGTHSEVCIEAVEANSSKRGTSKLSDAQVIHAREQLRTGRALLCDLAEAAGVRGTTLKAAATGRTHKALNEDYPPFTGTLPLGNAGRGGRERPRNYRRLSCLAFQQNLGVAQSA